MTSSLSSRQVVDAVTAEMGWTDQLITAFRSIHAPPDGARLAEWDLQDALEWMDSDLGDMNETMRAAEYMVGELKKKFLSASESAHSFQSGHCSTTSDLMMSQDSSSGDGGASNPFSESREPSLCGGHGGRGGGTISYRSRLDGSISPRKDGAAQAENPKEISSSDGEDRESLSLSPDDKEELSHTKILEVFDHFPQVQSFQPLVAAILGFWMLLPVLREKVNPPVLKKILGLITDEHKPALPEKTSCQPPKRLFQVGSRYPRRYTKLLEVLKKYGVMGFDLRNLTNIIVGLLFGTLNPFLVSNFIEHIHDVDITKKEVKTTLVFTLMFLSAVMRNTVLVKKPEQLYSFVQFLLENFNKDDNSWIDQIDKSKYDSDFLAAVKVVFEKVCKDFKSISEGKALSEEQIARFQKDLAEFALPEADDMTSHSQKLSEDEVPIVLVESYNRHWFALQNLVPRLLMSRGAPLFEFTGDFSKYAHFFLFFTLLTSSCRKSRNIFHKELEKVLRAFEDVKQKNQRLNVFGKNFETPMSKLFNLIRLLFLEESDAFIDQFFEFDCEGNKFCKDQTSLPGCLSALLDKMHEIANFSFPVYQSMKERIIKNFPNASVAAASGAVAGGGLSAHEGISFRPGQNIKSALKKPSDSATASVFTADALCAHTASQTALAKQLVTIGITTPQASMDLAAKFNEAGVNGLKHDLKGLSKEDVTQTLSSVSVTLTPVQLNKLLQHVAEK